MNYEVRPIKFDGITYNRVDDDRDATFFGLYENDEWLCDCRDRKTANRISFALEYYKDITYNKSLREIATYNKKISI